MAFFFFFSLPCVVLVLISFPSGFAVLVPLPSPLLTYHGGPLLSTKPSLDVYLVWYGHFSKPQKRIVVDFIASIALGGTPTTSTAGNAPSVASWWRTMSFYKDHNGSAVSPGVNLAGQLSNTHYTHGKLLTSTDIETIAKEAVGTFTLVDASSAVYIVLTSQNVLVEGFCESQCATHALAHVSGLDVPFIWVGNSATQCPGQCAWPFALPQFMDYNSLETPKGSPNGDPGMDGMVINIATILVGAVTNPHGNGYYEGDPQVPLEAGTACAGIFGEGAYPGDPGALHTDSIGASYNAFGINMRRFLLPALWNPQLHKCTPLT